jgi:hypothetical protein
MEKMSDVRCEMVLLWMTAIAGGVLDIAYRLLGSGWHEHTLGPGRCG